MTESRCVMRVLHVYDLRSFSFSSQQLFVFVLIFGRILKKPIFGTALLDTLVYLKCSVNVVRVTYFCLGVTLRDDVL